MRDLFTIQYLGTRYSGWQTQVNATGVQQVIEEALTRVYGSPIQLHSAGRTDAGVHALAQRAHADVPFEIPRRGLILGINNLLPSDIRVTNVETVGENFHARFDAQEKTYRYSIWNAEVADVFAAETHAHVGQPLDADRMHQAAQRLVGKHDFRAFTVAEPEVKTTVRTMTAMKVERDERAILITGTADGFLRYQMRRIAGMLIEVGRRKLDVDALGRAIEPAFEIARWTAPAKGLTLMSVGYGADLKLSS
jgi:tRNA pseudouridine38-40 synthase